MSRFILNIAFLTAIASFAVAQRPSPVQNGLDVLLNNNGVMDLHTLEEMDQTSRTQTQTRSEENLSKLDLKAPSRARRYYQKGLLAFAKKDYNAASENLKQAIALYPDFVSAHNALGCTYFSLGQNQLALAEFERATQLDDHLSNSFVNLGRAELALGQNSAAQSAFGKAHSLSPLNSSVMLALTYAQYLSRDYSGAIDTAKQTHDHPHPGAASVHYFAAASWQAQQHIPEARAELETFLSEDPTSPLAEQARKTIAQIQRAEVAPPASATASPTFAAENTSPSLLGEKALQDYREKQQIAEAENSESCASCNAEAGPADASAATPHVASRSAAKTMPYTFRSVVDEVAVFFTATNHGKSVRDLKQSDITVLDDKRPPATVLDFRTESQLPLRLALIIDTSQSITDRISFEQAAGANFLREVLTGKDDLAFVAGFSNSIILVQDFTHDFAQLEHGLNQLVPVGGTAIWDAVSFAADKLTEKKDAEPVARMIVVVSDGDDNASSTTLKQAIERAQHDEVAVYAVSTRYDDPENSLDSTGNRAMKTLAELTGGAAFFPGSAGHLKRSLADMEQFIRSRYLISYRPADLNRDGRYRTLQITAQQAGHKLKVNARKGYYPTAR